MLIKKELSFHQVISLPHEIVVKRYSPVVTFWQEGKESKQINLECSANPLCELICCHICKEALLNPQCASPFETLIIVVTLCCGIACLYFLLKIVIMLLICLRRLLIIIFWIVCKVVGRVCRSSRNIEMPVPTNQMKPKRRFKYNWRQASRIVVLIILVSSPGIAMSCSKIVSFSANTENSVRDKTGKQTCTISESVRVTVTPQG